MAKLCFGGSFNPIHNAHLACAQTVAQRRVYEKVVLIPSKLPPHKTEESNLASPSDRLEMCRLAADSNPDLFETSDIELNLPAPSYTIDTVRALRRKGWTEVAWLIGADMVRILPKWHKAKILLREVEFVIIARPGWAFDWETLPPEFQELRANVVEAPMMDISASEVRRRIHAGEPFEDLVPANVARYIRNHHLYGA